MESSQSQLRLNFLNSKFIKKRKQKNGFLDYVYE